MDMNVQCQSLKHLTIGSPSLVLGSRVFSKSGFVGVALPHGLRVIGTAWFADCIDLKFVEIPSSVVEISDRELAQNSNFLMDWSPSDLNL
eukprot:scaffold328_cov130-Cylindrotheca_fusiformis.AAC.26